MTNIYSYFDDIVCITLENTVDRKEQCDYYFKKLGIPVRFFIAKKHPNGGMYGCFDSHIKVIKEAYYKGCKNLLVFEDDIMPTSSYSENYIKNAIDFMNSNDDWGVFYFGFSFCNVYNNKFLLNADYIQNNIIQFNPLLTHSLCYNRNTMKKIIDSYDNFIGKVHYDVFLSKDLGLKNYCLIPIIFTQNLLLDYNVEPQDIFEYFGRLSFPIVHYIQLDHKWSLIKYYMIILYNIYNNYYIYIHIIAIIIILFILWCYI